MKDNLRPIHREELIERLPRFGALADKELDQIKVPIKVVSPLIDWEWYLYEYSDELDICMGYVKGFENEIGTISICELMEICGRIDDTYIEQTLKELTGW